MKAAKAVRDAVEAESSSSKGSKGSKATPQGAFARTVAESRKVHGKRKREEEGDKYVARLQRGFRGCFRSSPGSLEGFWLVRLAMSLSSRGRAFRNWKMARFYSEWHLPSIDVHRCP